MNAATAGRRDGLNSSADRLAEFCRRRGLRSLAVFGSFLRDDFHDDSDIDLLYQRRPGVSTTLDDLPAVRDGLTPLLGRRVELVDKSAVEGSPNYLRRRHILSTAETVYVEEWPSS